MRYTNLHQRRGHACRSSRWASLRGTNGSMRFSSRRMEKSTRDCTEAVKIATEHRIHAQLSLQQGSFACTTGDRPTERTLCHVSCGRSALHLSYNVHITLCAQMVHVFLCCGSSHQVELGYITLRYITSHYITLHHTTPHHTTSHYITLHYITLHCTIFDNARFN